METLSNAAHRCRSGCLRLRTFCAEETAGASVARNREWPSAPLTSADVRLLFQSQNPAYEILDVGIRYLNIGRHRNVPPNANAALLHLVGEFGERILIALVLGGDILIGRADDFLFDGMARRAAALLHQRLRGGVVERGVGRLRHEQSSHEENALPKRVTCHATSGELDGTIGWNDRENVKFGRHGTGTHAPARQGSTSVQSAPSIAASSAVSE